MKTAKDKAIDLVSRLPEEASWQETIYRLEVRRKIEEGIKAAEGGRVLSHDEVKKLFAQDNVANK
jgi:predicted transcriptional regulator